MRKIALILTLAFITALMLTACGGDGGAEEEPPAKTGDAVAGADLFLVCAGCHGPDAKGLPNNGKDLTTSTFSMELSDEELVEFLKTGRPIGDPENTTNIDMPPKGGNPAFSDDDLLNIVAFVRTLEE